MALGRELANAYIDVHGDIERLRRDVSKAKPMMQKGGADAAESFNEAFKKRMDQQKDDRWNGLMDGIAFNRELDWDKLFGSFDSTDIDVAHEKTQAFIKEMQDAGRLSEEQWASASASARRARDSISGTTSEMTRYERAITRASERAQDHERSSGAFTRMKNAIKSMVPDIDKTNSGLGGMKRITDTLKKGFGGLKKSWQGMDDDVKAILAVILASAGPLAAGLSGIAASVTAVASSLAYAVLAAVPLASAFAGIAVGIGLAVSGFDDMLKMFPGIKTEMKGIGDVWQAQSKRFAAAWGPAFQSLMASFRKQLGSVDFGTALGQSFAEITRSFEGVVNGSGFRAFLKAMAGDIPDAVAGIGKGLAGLTDALFNLLAGAAPVAAKLGEDFAKWGAEVGKAMESARKSGKLNEVFEKARESLKVVLNLVGSIGKAFGTIFAAGVDTGNDLLRSLTGLIDKWNTWMQSSEGQDWLKQWFEDGARIIKSFGPLLVGVAKLLDELVTPNSIAQFEKLMGTVGAFLPILGQLLSVISDLGIFNLLAELLLGIGTAIQPLLPSLGELARLISEGVSGAIQALSPIMQGLTAILKPIIEALVEIGSAVIPVVVDAFGRIATALAPVLEVLGQVVDFIVGFLAPILTDLLIGAINNVVGVIQGLADVFMGIVDVIKGFAEVFMGVATGDMERVKEGFATVWEGIKQIFFGAIEAVWNFIQLWFLGKMMGAIKGFMTGIGAAFKTGWTNIKNFFNTTMGAISNMVNSIFTGIGNFIKFLWNGIVNFFKTIWNGIVNVVYRAVVKVRDHVSVTMERVKAIWNRIWEAISGVASKVWNSIKDFVTKGVNGISSTIGNVLGGIRNTWNGIWESIKTFVGGIWNGIKDGVRNSINTVKDTLSNVLNNILSKWHSVWNDAIGKFKDVFGKIVGAARDFMGNIKDRLYDGAKNAINWMKSGLSGMYNTFWNALAKGVEAVRNGFDYMKSWVSWGIDSVMWYFRNLPTLVWNALINIGSTLQRIGTNMIEGLIGGIKNMANRVIGAVGGVIQGGIDWAKNMLGIHSPSRVFRQFGRYTGEGLALGMRDNRRDVQLAGADMAKSAISAITVSKMQAAGRDAATGFADGLASNADKVQGALAGLSADAVPEVPTKIVGGLAQTAALNGAGAGGTVIEAGAIQVNTPATDGVIVAEQMLDEMARRIGQ